MKQTYEKYKHLLAETEAAKVFDDQYAFVYVENETDLPDGGRFVCLTTGYNRDSVVSFVQTKENAFYVRTWTKANYSGYSCECDGTNIKEVIRHTWGSTETNVYDLTFQKIKTTSTPDYGCCCG